MSPSFSSRTRLLTLLGDPVQHSLSPDIQNVACRRAGVDGVYVSLCCSEKDLPHLMRGIAAAGGGGNVTLPHKERAAAVVTLPSEAVRRTGACNTFWGDGQGGIRGDNTDVEGFVRALRRFRGRSAEGLRVLLLGAGGAARAVLVGLMDEGARDVLILNRSVERARAVARRIGGERVRVAEGPDSVEGGDFDLVVNATRLGLHPRDALPLQLDRLKRVGGAMDLVYGPGGTQFVRAAGELGIPATDGAEMLVQQGAVSFERWWDREAPVDAMREVLSGASAGV